LLAKEDLIMEKLTLVQLKNSLYIASFNLNQATNPVSKRRATRYSKLGSSVKEIEVMRRRVQLITDAIARKEAEQIVE
jgi:hypothetical protein